MQATSPWSRSLPSATAVGDVVERSYGLSVSSVELVRSFTNDVYRVETADRAYAWKLYGAARWSVDEVRWEQELLGYLINSGIPVSASVALLDGDFAGLLAAPEGGRAFAMTEWLPGAKPQSPWTDELYRSVGALVGRLHLALDQFASSRPRRPARRTDEVGDVLAVLRDHDHHDLVRLTGREAERQLDQLTAQGLMTGLRHGDATLDNVHAGDQGLSFYDFDLAGPGWQVEDLTGALSTPFAEPYLAGYEAIRSLAAVEREALPWLRILDVIGNLRFHLIEKPAMHGTASLAEGWVDAGFDSLIKVADEVGL